ncbi:MAG: hypothetical protein IKD96_00430 [Oscillospiraceae bacterium]|nr:hypothetical protein [Oscillospiraceae bacterium]
MAHNFEEVRYSRTQVKKAGKIYVSENTTQEEKDRALILINNWRAAHSFPLQVIYMHVKRNAGAQAIVAQRLKRLYSITQKLHRFPNMSLTAMQDIGGCRVIVDSISDVYSMVSSLKKSRMRHKLKEEYDYIRSPKPDGYRSYHIVYSYFSEKNPKYNGLFIEIQIRTHIQHLWATAVETMDTFTGDPLKTGQGDPENRQFFVLISKLLEAYESSNQSIDDVKRTDSLQEFLKYEKEHEVLRKLKSIKEAVGYVQSVDNRDQGYYVLRLDREKNQLLINSYTKKQLEQATAEYDLAEKNRSVDEDIVLVSTASFNMLKKAYPNYFADINEFIELIDSFVN